MSKIATVGDNCMDVYEELGTCYPGGNSVNSAVYTVRMGGQASYTGVVGDDEYGRIMRTRLEEVGVDTSHLKMLPGKTAVTQVTLRDGDRVFGDYDEGVMENLVLTDEDIAFLASHDMVLSGLWGNVHGDLHRVRALGTPVAFDFATKLDHPTVGEAIEHVDYAFFAYDEGDNAFIRDYLKKMKERGPKIAVATLGSAGSVAYDSTGYHTFGIIPCEVVDTMGAGDSYIAAFLLGVLAGESVERCMEMGAENASRTIGYNGAW